jgi:hypothetical protein
MEKRIGCMFAFALVLGTGLGCSPDLGSQSLVDKFRVIAIKATPASGAPGQLVTVEALMSDSANGGAPSFVIWAACFPLPGQTGRQCMQGGATPESPMSQWQFIGLEPTATFMLPDLADDEDEQEVFIVFAACTGLPNIPDCECPGPDCESCLEDFDMFSLCEDGEDALAYKSVRSVRDVDNGNQNPQMVAVLRDGEVWEPDDVPLITCDEQGCEKWEIAVEATAESAETYTQIRFDEVVQFTEAPYAVWFATAGEYDMERSAIGETEQDIATVGWTPDLESYSIKFYFVLYDGRGGVDWATREATTI